MAIRLHSSGTLPWVPEVFHAWFPVSGLQSDPHEKRGFSRGFAARVKDNNAHSRSFFLFRRSYLWPNSARKTSCTQGTGTFAHMLILCKKVCVCKPLAFIGKTVKKCVKNSLKYCTFMKTHFHTFSFRLNDFFPMSVHL